MLIKDSDRLILIDTGMGRKREDKYYEYRYLTDADSLAESFKKYGFSFEHVTDVLFTHLHDDHCGGAIALNKISGMTEPVFKNADYWCSEQQWHHALNPNKREAASFFKDNLLPLKETGRLHLIKSDRLWHSGIEIRLLYGHTMGLILPLIPVRGRILAFVSDFIPSSAHIPLPFIASVDIQPLESLREKESFLNEAADKNFILFFEHDSMHECCTVKHTEKGVRINETFELNQFIRANADI